MPRQIGEWIHFLSTSKAERSTAGKEKRDVRSDVRSDVGEL